MRGSRPVRLRRRPEPSKHATRFQPTERKRHDPDDRAGKSSQVARIMLEHTRLPELERIPCGVASDGVRLRPTGYGGLWLRNGWADTALLVESCSRRSGPC